MFCDGSYCMLLLFSFVLLCITVHLVPHVLLCQKRSTMGTTELTQALECSPTSETLPSFLVLSLVVCCVGWKCVCMHVCHLFQEASAVCVEWVGPASSCLQYGPVPPTPANHSETFSLCQRPGVAFRSSGKKEKEKQGLRYLSW